MGELTKQLELSIEVIEAARKYADKWEYKGTVSWLVRYNSFLAGAYFMKPIEHEATPKDNGRND